MELDVGLDVKSNEVEPKKATDKLASVSTVKLQGQSALVEWRDGKTPKRAFVPRDEVRYGKCKQGVLDAGIPYGVDWAACLKKVSVTPEQVDAALKNAGYWTPDDFVHPNQVQAILHALTGLTSGALHTAGKEYLKGK